MGNDATTSIKGDTTVALTHFFLVVFKRFSDSKSFQSLGFFHGWPFPLHLFGCFVTVNIFTRSSSPSSYSSPALTNSKFLAFRSLFIFVLPACRHCCHRVFCFVLLTILLECMRTLFWTLLTEESVLKFSGFFSRTETIARGSRLLGHAWLLLKLPKVPINDWRSKKKIPINRNSYNWSEKEEN